MDPRSQKGLMQALIIGEADLKSSAKDLQQCAKALDELAKKGLLKNEKDTELFKEFSKVEHKANSLGVESDALSRNHDMSFGGRVLDAKEKELRIYLIAVQELRNNVTELKQKIDNVEKTQEIKFRK